MAILLVFAMILAGVAQAAPVVEAEEVNSNVIRLSGADRIKTSVKISQTAYKDGAESVVIVGYEGEVDALAGTLLAHAKKGPVLFTKKGKLSEDTKTEIARLGAKNVYILGGTATIEDAVKTELETLKYTVKRISGSNREGTAAAVAKEVGGKTTHVFLARGYGDLRAVLSDALAVGPASAKGNMAVLLTRTDKVPAATLKSMKDLGVTNVTIVGGEVAVNSGVKTELETLKYTVDRLSGTTREGTAIAIANKYFAGKANALVANGYGSPDALVGGYLGAAIDAPILFSQANKVSEVTTDYLKANTEKAWILGGERVVNKEVLNKVLGAVVPTPTPPSTGGGSGGGSGDNVAVNTISVKPTELTLTVGETGNITATVDPTNATNKNVTWSSSDTAVATVDGNGKVTAVGYGIATITVTSAADNTKAATCKVIVANDWSDLADTSWYDDSQTSFTISTAAKLAGLAELVNSGTNFSGKTINLGADIDLLNLEWIPIGTKENPFKGNFNGADKEISNLKIDKPEENYKGLFGVIGTGTVIKDMSMKDVNITGYGWLGAVAGLHKEGSTLTIDNVDVKDITLNGHRMIGGVLGQSYNGAQAEIKDCDLTNVTINNSVKDKDGNGDKSGGIIGHAGSIKLTSNSVTNLNLYAYRDSGGITGYSETLSNISGNIVTTGNLRLDKTQEKATGEAVDNKWNLGAIVGRPNTKTQSLGEGNSFDKVNSSIKEKDDEDFRVIETVVVGYTPIIVEESGSIQAAISAAEAGDTILIASGTYVVNQTIQTDKELTIIGNGTEKTIIDVSSVPDNAWGVLINKSNSTIKDLTIKSEKTQKYNNNLKISDEGSAPIGKLTGISIINVSLEGGKGLDVYKSSVKLDNVKVSNSLGASIAISNGSNVEISNTTTENGAWGSLGVMYKDGYAKSSVSILDGNNFEEGLLYEEGYKNQESNQITGLANWESFVNERDQLIWVRELPKGAYISSDGVLSGCYNTIQAAIDTADTGDTILIASGTYDLTSTLTINKSITVQGIDKEEVILKGANSITNTIYLGNGATLKNVTVTRDNSGDWANNKNNQLINFYNSNDKTTTLEECIITGGRNGVYVNNKTDIVIKDNLIDNNRTGIQMANCNDATVENNIITNNHTMGVLLLEFESVGTGKPIFTGNEIRDNWYSDFENRWAAEYVVDLTNNTFTDGTYKVADTSGEPGYVELHPVELGGTATRPEDRTTFIMKTAENLILPSLD